LDIFAGFQGCFGELEVDGNSLPMGDGAASERFDVEVLGKVDAGCEAIPLGSTTADGLYIAVIVIVIFFVLVVAAIIIGFIVIRRRKQKKKSEYSKQNGSVMSKSNGAILDKANGDNRSHQDSGFTESGDLSEEAIIRQHIAEELATRMYNEREISHLSAGGRLTPNRPDILARQSVDLGDGTVIVENGIDNVGYSDEPPEHYDIDNASSIAPSDLVDVVSHYKRYRHGIVGNHNNHKHRHGAPHRGHPHRHSPSPLVGPIVETPQKGQSPSVGLHSDSPGVLTMQSTPIVRQSPLGNGIDLSRQQSPLTVSSAPSPLTVGNVKKLTRNSPLHPSGLSRTSPITHLPRPGATSPLYVPSSVRSTPINGLYSGNLSDTSGGMVKPPRPSSQIQQPYGYTGRPVTPKGLTVEEVNRLNARAKQSPVSTLDALSSSSEEHGQAAKINQTEFRREDLFDPSRAMPPPDSSSEESANDSFTCSDFSHDFDAEKLRNEAYAKRAFPKLPQVNEHEDTPETSRTYNEGSDSNRSFSTLFASDNDESGLEGKKKFPNGALSWDYLLNWGPNFEKLVGVFSDIAQLPDAGTAYNQGRGMVHDRALNLPQQSSNFTSHEDTQPSFSELQDDSTMKEEYV
jgi:protocadherin Fat 4